MWMLCIGVQVASGGGIILRAVADICSEICAPGKFLCGSDFPFFGCVDGILQ